MIGSIIASILAVSFYLLTANAISGSGGDPEKLANENKNAKEFIEVVKTKTFGSGEKDKR